VARGAGAAGGEGPAAPRDLHGQGGRGDPLAVGGPGRADPGQAGETVPIQAVLAKLETDQAASLPAERRLRSGTRRPRGSPATWRAPRSRRSPRPLGSSRPPRAVGPSVGRTGPDHPVVARMAAEHGLDLSKIPGTGIDGRVTRKDVEGFLASGGVPPAGPPKAAPHRGRNRPFLLPRPGGRPHRRRRLPPPRKLRRQSPRSRRGPGRPVDADPEEDRGAHGPEQATPRPTSTSSRRWTCTRWRRFAPRRKRRGEPHLSSLRDPRAAKALRETPIMNAIVSGESTVLKKDIHIAVAVDTEKGLLVPCFATRTGCP